MWSFSSLKGDKWITKERYNCESCGHMQDAELPEPLWKIWINPGFLVNAPREAE